MSKSILSNTARYVKILAELFLSASIGIIMYALLEYGLIFKLFKQEIVYLLWAIILLVFLCFLTHESTAVIAGIIYP